MAFHTIGWLLASSTWSKSEVPGGFFFFFFFQSEGQMEHSYDVLISESSMCHEIVYGLFSLSLFLNLFSDIDQRGIVFTFSQIQHFVRGQIVQENM